MKTISVALAAHFALNAATVATCWLIVRRDGARFAFTDHVDPLTIDGDVYLASSGYTSSNIETSAALNVDNLEVSGGLDSSAITEADLLAGKWDFAEVRIFEVNYTDLSQGKNKLRRGWLGEVKTNGPAFTAELRGMMQALQQNIGRIVSPACDAAVGDARCGLDLDVLTDGRVAGAVTAVTSARVFTAAALTQAGGWFDGGVVTWTSGANAGLEMEVRTFAAGLVSLVLPMPFAVAVSDAFSITVGCDNLVTTCRDKFANVVNFRGFPHVPGVNRIMSGT